MMKTPSFRRALALFSVLFSFAVLAGPVMAQSVIQEIRVKGVERIEPATVLSYMDLRPGDEMERDALDTALKNLFRTGLFADVTFYQDQNALIVDIVENPIINSINFEGNDKVEDDDLLAEIQMRPRQAFTRPRVQADLSRLYQVYRRNGRFAVSIDPKIVKLDQNRVDVVFEVDEGIVTKVESIRFVGNRRFDDATLRSEISTKESRWYRFVSADDRYDPDRMAYDQDLLRRFYLSQGYADFRVLSANAELSQDRKNFYLTFTVEEGPRYRVGSVDVDSALRNFDAQVLYPEITVKNGEWYDASQVQDSIDRMVRKLGDMQYAFVNVRPRVERDRSKNTVQITFFIEETPRIFVERIDIHGNQRTEDRVVRREFELAEGDPFNRTKLAESEQNIRDLDYFEKVEVTHKPGSAADKAVLDVEVAEKSTGELSIGGGFSTSDGPLADLRLRERNFLGRGQELLLAATISGSRTEFDAGFTEPYFLGRDLQAGVDLFHITRDLQDESSFDQQRTGGALRIGYPLSKSWRQSLRYSYERNDIKDVKDTASLYIQEQAGERVTSAVSQRLTYDTRDSRLFPTDGFLGWFDVEVAGLGGDAQYVSGKLGGSYFYPVADNWVFNLLAEGGTIHGWGGETVQINERFFLGGNTLRGFEQAGIGPRDLDTEDALGGNYFYRGTAELSFPTGLPQELGVKAHAFTDFGSLWDVDQASTAAQLMDDSSIRVSTGLGLSWRSPLGPIRIDYGIPIKEESYDQAENFRFSFGTRF